MESNSKQNEDLYFGYEAAPSKNIPQNKFLLLNIPAVKKVLKRPDDPFCHPINGDVIPTSNLLLKVTRRKKKQNKTVNHEEEKTSVKDDVNFDYIGNYK
ncbi:unnamed protein product [Rhizophagus irregularis]|nr:unnamed protein product [Rhizophagus irregularis]